MNISKNFIALLNKQRFILVLLFLFMCSIYNSAQTQITKLKAADGGSERYFGNAVAIYDNTVIIGVPFDDTRGFTSGAVYIFKKKNNVWEEESKLIGSDIDAYDFFGTSVDIAKNVIIVGASGDQSSGSAYIFRFDGSHWNEEAILYPDDGQNGDLFGSFVSIDRLGKYVVVGSPGDDFAQGSAYCYTNNNGSWQQMGHIWASDGNAGLRFGVVRMNETGELILVGERVGVEVHLYMKDGPTWVRVAKLSPPAGSLEEYGDYLDLSNDYIVIGDRGDDGDDVMKCGTVNIFKRSNNSWQWEAKITASDPIEGQKFGTVAISGSTILVGASHDNENGLNAGATYVFTYEGNNWIQKAKILADDGFANDSFGASVDIHGSTAIIGSPYDNDQGSSSGAAYVFDLSDITGTIDLTSDLPNSFLLEQNYPNPFNPTTKINYSLPVSSKVSLVVYDILGIEIKTLVNEFQNAGRYTIDFNSVGLSSGVYFYRISADQFSETKKLILLK